MSRAVFLPLLAMLALSGCSSGPLAPGASGGNGGQVSLATQTACRERMNQMYDERNRGDIFAANSSMNSPLSANYLSGDTSRGLADQFSYGKLESECERNDGADPNQSEVQPAPAAPVAKGH